MKTEACGVCHTDLHAAKGDWPVKPSLHFPSFLTAFCITTPFTNGYRITDTRFRESFRPAAWVPNLLPPLPGCWRISALPVRRLLV